MKYLSGSSAFFSATTPVTEDLTWVERLSPYAWAYSESPLESGLGWGIAAVWGVAIVFTGAAALALRSRDVTG